MKEFDALLELVEILRSDRGCAWDRSLSIDAFKTFLIEEVYELVEAIDKKDIDSIKEELGDLLFHIVFISQIAKEESFFNVKEVLKNTYEKMYRRHPHVFEKEKIDSIEEKWEDLKKKEKKQYSLLGNIPRTLPALLKAYLVSKRVEKVGFDWEEKEGIYEKITEEIEELREAEIENDKEKIREEIGDLLFAIVQISRFHRTDPEDALRFTVEKFVRRFSFMEKQADLTKLDTKTMNELWERAKDTEKKGA